MGQLIVEIKNVSFQYADHQVLEDVSLDIHQGNFMAMIGPNGGGKTTLLKLILGLLQPKVGSIRVLEQPAAKSSHLMGYVPQNVHINPRFPITALEIVLMGKLEPRKKRRLGHSRLHRQEAMQALERLEMDTFANRKIGELSGGQLQRVFIARALVTRPRLLLLDEPTASIDSKGQADFYRLLKQLNADTTIVVVSHDLLAISVHVKTVACVNGRLHYHNQAEITGEMLETMYPCSEDEVCPVELLAHGLPHRVLKDHEA
jgi:zinc transport system ATP-binding protein